MIDRTKENTEIVYGVHAVLELLKAKKRRVIKIYTTRPEPSAFGPIKALALAQKVTIVYKDRQTITSLTGGPDHQGVFALAAPFVWRAQPFNPQKQRLVVLLDGVMDVRNVGAIIRSAYCAGFSGVVLPRKSTAPLNAAAIKASAGLAEHMQLYRPNTSALAIQELQKSGYQIYVTALSDKAQSALEIQYAPALCVVIGSEDTGVSRELLSKGTVIRLPQRTPDISYNASVAAGIIMFVIAAQQRVIT